MKRHKRKYMFDAPGGVNLGIIITPFLDMAFQLLAFFIMTYRPPVNEGYFDGALLPPTKVATKGKTVDPKQDLLPALDKEPELSDALLIVVRAVGKGQIEGDRSDGDPRWVEIKRAEAATNVTLATPDVNLKVEPYVKELEKELDRELKELLKKSGGKATDIKLEADANLKHRYWMRFYDVCKLAGFPNIHFVSPAPERPK